MAFIPEYRFGGRENSHPYARSLRGIALAIGVLALIGEIGIFIFSLLSLNRANDPDDGLSLALIFDLLLLLIGAAFLSNSYLIIRRSHPSAPRALMQEERVAFIILLANFVFTAVAFWGFRYIAYSTSISVRNDGEKTVTRFVVSSNHGSIDFGSVSPGASVQQRIHWSGGPLRFERVDGGQTTTGSIAGTAAWAESPSEMRSVLKDGIKIQVRGDKIEWK